MATSTTEQTTKVTLVLDEKEAIYLRALVQNSIYPRGEEPEEVQKIRLAIFDALPRFN